MLNLTRSKADVSAGNLVYHIDNGILLVSPQPQLTYTFPSFDTLLTREVNQYIL
jgi:hypothetical protein